MCIITCSLPIECQLYDSKHCIYSLFAWVPVFRLLLSWLPLADCNYRSYCVSNRKYFKPKKGELLKKNLKCPGTDV